MSGPIIVKIDDQSTGLGQPRRGETKPVDRRNYGAEIIEVKRKPSSGSHRPVSRYLNDYSSFIPQQANEGSSGLPIKVHSSHKPLISPGFMDLIIDTMSPSDYALAKPKRNILSSFSNLQLSMFVLAAVALVVGGYMSFVGLRYNNIAKNQAANLTSIANSLDKGKPTTKGSGSNSALSDKPVTASDLASYTVAPDMPRYLLIPKLNVDARILSVGLTKAGALNTPGNVFDTAWYNKSALPGQPGAMLIDGHVSSWTSHGVFYGIKSLVSGDIINVQRGDGTVFTYKVVKSQIYNTNNVDMKAAVAPVVSSAPGLNLISCAGDVIPGTNSFNERIIVFATLVSS